jgi:hypothetical protein
MQRPIGVTLTAILMVVNIFVDVALSLISPTVVRPNDPSHGPEISTFVIVLHIALVAFVVMQCVVVLYYWLGRSWARWFVLVGCIFYLIGLKDLSSQWHLHHSYVTAALTLGSAALAVYLIWYLHTRDVRDWFARGTATATSK